MNRNELIVQNPNGDIDLASKLTVDIQKWGRAKRAEFEAIEPDGSKDQAATWTELKKIDGEIKDKTDKVVEEVAKLSGIKMLIIQLAAERKAFKALYTEKWEKFCEIRDKGKPQAPVRAHAVTILATDEGLTKLIDQINKGKIAGVSGLVLGKEAK